MGTDGGEPPCNTHEFSIGGGDTEKGGVRLEKEEKEKKIKLEFNKLKKLFKDLEKDKVELVNRLM